MPLTREKAQLMSASEIDRSLVRLAHEILEKTEDLDKLAFIGIRRRGVPLAQRLAAKIASPREARGTGRHTGYQPIPRRSIDGGSHPVLNATEIHFSVTGKDIILTDDVLYTGRTIRAALDALFDHGRPARVQLLVLIDRGHRELPIEARYVGRMVQTSANEIIEVKFREIDGLEEGAAGGESRRRRSRFNEAHRPARNRRTGARRNRSDPAAGEAFSAGSGADVQAIGHSARAHGGEPVL